MASANVGYTQLGVPLNVLIKSLMITRYLNGEMIISGNSHILRLFRFT